MNYLVRLANAFMRVSALAAVDEALRPAGWSDEQWANFSWIFEITNVIEMILWPLLIVVASAGSIYAVVLGVNMARADSTEKREEGKKRLINVLIGMAVIIGLILFMQLFINAILPAFFK